MTTDEIKMMNCSECQVEMLGPSMFTWYRLLSDVTKKKFILHGGELNGRPVCQFCIIMPKGRDRFGGNVGPLDNDAWQQNALRAWEDQS